MVGMAGANVQVTSHSALRTELALTRPKPAAHIVCATPENTIDVIRLLSGLFIMRGIPGHIRSDNRPEFVAEAVHRSPLGCRDRLHRAGQPLGRTATSRASTRVFVTSSSTVKSSIHCRRAQIVIESCAVARS